MFRTAFAAKLPGHIRSKLDVCRKSLRIHLFYSRMKYEIAAVLLKYLAVSLKIPRIAFQIFAFGKLSRIHEHRRYHLIAGLRCRFHQRSVSFMQSSHGRNKPHGKNLSFFQSETSVLTSASQSLQLSLLILS